MWRRSLLRWLFLVPIMLSLVWTPATGPASVMSAGATFTNPVYRANFPDPFVLRVGKTYYAYATGTCSDNLQVIQSPDLVHWSGHKDPLPKVPSWAPDDCVQFFQNRLLWAPEVLHRKDGKYVMYYVARSTATGKQCVTVALSDAPDGPFVDSSSKPLICQVSQGGSIDPSPFTDRKGLLYLLWKNDGNCCHLPTYLYSQRLDSSGTKLLGKARRLIDNSQVWEGDLVEAPDMLRVGKTYYLFFSASFYASTSYAVGFAVCKAAQGPCKQSSHNPILSSRCTAAGPGGEAFISDARGQLWIVYHAWKSNAIGDAPGAPGRQLWLDRVTWNKGNPVVHGPTCKAQSAPAVK